MPVPVISERAEKALRELGLTEYECQTYLSLLFSGEDTAEAVSQISNIPYTKVYGILDNLEKGGIEHVDDRPRKYYPRSPIDALRSEQISLEKGFQENQSVILEEIQPLYERKEIKEIPELWIIRGEIISFNKIADLLGKAEREIILAIPTVPEGLIYKHPEITRKIFSFQDKIMDERVKVKGLTTIDTKQLLDTSDLGLAEVRICEDMFGGGIVIDGRETILFLDLVHPRGGPDTAIWSEHETITSISMI